MTTTKSKQDPYLPQPSLRRLPMYFAYLKEQQEIGLKTISSSRIAEDLGLHAVQVRKDLALTQVVGRPRTGFDIHSLLTDIRRLLDYDNIKPALLIGTGHLGSALLAYRGFAEFGLKLVAACDDSPYKIGQTIGGVEVRPTTEIKDLIRQHSIQIGILTTPAAVAQDCCDLLVKGGIKAIWNFAPIHLTVPKGIVLQHENIAVSLSVLSKKLSDQER